MLVVAGHEDELKERDFLMSEKDQKEVSDQVFFHTRDVKPKGRVVRNDGTLFTLAISKI